MMSRKLATLALMLCCAVGGYLLGRINRVEPMVRASPASAASTKKAAPATPKNIDDRNLRADKPYMTVLQAMALKKAGTYIPDLDVDEFNDQLKEKAERYAQANMAREQDRYIELFDRMGLSPQQSEQALQHLQAIIKSKIYAGYALTSLANAQSDYEQKMRTVLGSKFDAYLEYETGDLGRREVEFASEFLRGKNTELSTAERDLLQAAMQGAGSYSDQSLGAYGGAFNTMQPRSAGGALTIESQERRLLELKHNVDTLTRDERFQALPDSVQGLVAEYYSREFSRLEEGMLFTKYPEIGQLVLAEERLKKLRNDRTTNPRTIEQMEAIVLKLKAKAGHPGR